MIFCKNPEKQLIMVEECVLKLSYNNPKIDVAS